MPPVGSLLVALFLQHANGTAVTTPEQDVTAARLEVRGSADCLSKSDLAGRVAFRSKRIQFVDDAPVSARVSLRSARPGNVVAELVLAPTGSEQPARRFVARTCLEAADAIALVIAVTLDPMARTAAAQSDGHDQPRVASGKTISTPPSPAAGGDSNTAKAGDRSAASPSGLPPPPAAPGPPPTVSPPTPPTIEGAAPLPTPTTSSRRHYSAQLAGQTIFGPAPTVMPGPALYGMAAWDGDGWWAPALLVGAIHVWRSNLSEPGGTASFTLDAASLDACPVRLHIARVDLRPCASTLVGRLTARGADVDEPAGEPRRFAIIGAAANTAIQLGGLIELSIRVGLGWTLTRDSYQFDTAIFHRAGAVTTAASVGVGLHWP